jgi:hypothetical protein
LSDKVASEFSEIITTEAQLRSVIGAPSERALRKQIDTLDAHCRSFIARSPFLLIASCDAQGNMDVSPKGDPAGFVRVLDERTLAIPDRPGNRRADTFRNLMASPGIALIFLVPGREETLRVNGTGLIVRDRWVCEPMAVAGKAPDFAIVVRVREVFFHCAKCVIRSGLWRSDAWPAGDELSSLAQAIVEQGRLEQSVEEVQSLLEKDARERLY